jgi:hypothetical protein
MQVQRYTFQSPYPNQIQIGKPDTSSKEQESLQNSQQSLIQNSNETLKQANLKQEAKDFNVNPTTNVALDIYA